jgi:predicted transposase YdaD
LKTDSIFYKFPLLGREEIERMLSLGELRETRVYQEALDEGRQEGRQEGEQTGILKGEQAVILRLLTRRLGTIAPTTESQIRLLSLTQLEALGEALLDFSQPSDLTNWLRTLGAKLSHS